MEFVDTHCHIQFPDYQLDPEEVIRDAQKEGVTRLMAVGCTLSDSIAAVEMAKRHKRVYAAIGLHPHEGAVYVNNHKALQQFHELAGKTEVVAIGETGLDYYYNHSTADDQKRLLRFQLDMAQEHDLPLIFHIREAFDDFWKIFDTYKGLRGVVHSFTATQKELDQVLQRGLYVGINGIITFTKDNQQIAAVKNIPTDRLLLETDAPFLTPVPFRGKICQPKHVVLTAQRVADVREEALSTVAKVTTENAQTLFNLK
jgi:TatD DNase family protein